MVNNLHDVPSPYFTPLLAIYLCIIPVTLSTTVPLDYTYIFYIIRISYSGNFKSSTIAYHSFFLSMLSYARFRSINAIPSWRLVRRLCWMMVYRIRACSIVPWLALKPACVGAWRSRVSAAAVSL
jgi:hypothetical protein